MAFLRFLRSRSSHSIQFSLQNGTSDHRRARLDFAECPGAADTCAQPFKPRSKAASSISSDERVGNR